MRLLRARLGHVRLKEHAFAMFLAAGCAATAVYVALPQLPQAALYDGLDAACGLAIIAGIRLHRPRHPAPWLMLAVAQLCVAAGDVLWDYWNLALGEDPFPSAADVMYLASYPLMAGGLLCLARHRVPGGDWRSLLDASIVTVALGAAGWVYLVGPAIADAGDPVSLIIGAAYPLMDILLLAVLARQLSLPGGRVPAFWIQALALLAILVADVLFAVLKIEDVSALDLIWLFGYTCWATAALHPSMAVLDQPIQFSETQIGRVRLVFLGGAALLGPVMLFAGYLRGAPGDIPVLAIGSAVVFLLVVARMGTVVRDLGTTLRERASLETRLVHQALHDPLTGLANRALLADRLDHALRRRGDRVRSTAILLMDLDDFKTLNETLGHQVGDQLLAAVAERVRACVRPGDTAARMGGDEFAILLEDLADEIGAVRAIERLLAALDAPFVIGEHQVRIRASAGIAFAGSSSSTAEEVLRNADLAMYLAKRRGGSYEIFEPSMHRALLERVELQVDLERAVGGDQFVLDFQPIVSIADGRPRGSEALVRWRHPIRGLLPPGVFIPLAEETGLIEPLGRWVLETACRTMAAWRRHPRGAGLVIHVNLSVRQLQRPGFPSEVAAILSATGLDPAALVLEITESILLDESDVSRKNLAALRAMGVRLAIDDFGTGYASLSYLRREPVNVLKIDRSFVASVTDGPEAEALARAIVTLGDTFHLETVAEGVERTDELEVLRALGCRSAQGFLIARPMSQADAEVFLGISSSPKALTAGQQPAADTEPQRAANVVARRAAAG